MNQAIILKIHNREIAMEITLSQDNAQQWLAMLMTLNLLVLFSDINTMLLEMKFTILLSY
jgi:hypothetical protein